MTKELKTKFQLLLKKQCFLHFGVYLAACCRVGTALQNDLVPEGFLFGFSLNPEMVSQHWEEEQREQGGLYVETSTCRYCGTIPCTQGYVRERVLYSVHLEMGNQCRDGRTGVIYSQSQRFVLVTIEAAAFWIFCR